MLESFGCKAIAWSMPEKDPHNQLFLDVRKLLIKGGTLAALLCVVD